MGSSMKIQYFTHNPLNPKERNITFGQKVIGVRLLKLEISSQEDLDLLLSKEGSEWAKKHLRFSGVKYTSDKLLTLPTESNWGSDWVDDGV